ncbi:hypothetical protein JAAARDRAFT_37539 [Jaapia argillacea MUCL 33604]|uniref:Uncharacterized protein n=1 Tax=Jaapia argillacea MUCL 33604 TaxID=933084 RepID=A0A067PL53_9AGAM|nr:hypothetical protein JAAARDRAFT_37539 [Jaapia argillacea MUCL 33604]
MDLDEQNQHNTIADLSSSYPAHSTLISHLQTFLTTYPPPFIYITDTFTPRTTSTVLKSLLSSLHSQSLQPHGPTTPLPRIAHAWVNAVATFNSRIFFDTVLNDLVGWEPKWEDGCENWAPEGSGGGAGGMRYNENLDTFLHGLRAVYSHLEVQEKVEEPSAFKAKGRGRGRGRGTGKGKGKEKVEETKGGKRDVRMVVVVEKAERLREALPDLVVPLTRLAELSRTPITVILLSSVRWEDIKPPLGASSEPYYFDVPPPNRDSTIRVLTAHNPNPLYSHFISTLYSVCSPFTTDPDELQYIAASRWPAFVQAILSEFVDDDGGQPLNIDDIQVPEETRIRWLRQFTPTFTSALDVLYPRIKSATDLARPSPDDHSVDEGEDKKSISQLPRMQKFILVAAFLASTNPAKSDMRMFARGKDERKRRRRKSVNATPKKGGGAVKIPQRLLGPIPFPLDRLVAILGCLLLENDPPPPERAADFEHESEYTEVEVNRVAVMSSITSLTASHLLQRTSPPDRLDGPPMYRCGVGYEIALELSRDVGIILGDLLWEA